MKYLYLFFHKSPFNSLATALCLLHSIVLYCGCKTEFELAYQERSYEVILDLEIDPNDGNIIYAATGQGLYKSTNGGDSWSNILGYHIKAMAIHHIYSDTLYALGDYLYKSGNAGNSWRPIEIPFEGDVLKLSPLDNQTLFAGNGSGLYKSKDGGASWTNIISQNFSGISIDHKNQDILYLIRDDLYKSMDEGITWSSVMTGIRGSVQVIELDPQDSETLYCGTTSGLFKSSDGADNWVETQLNGSITSIAVHTVNSNILYVSNLNELFKSNDRGINWNEVAIVPALAHPTFEISSVKMDPFNSDIIFVALTGDPWSSERGVLKSEDGGETWESKSSGLPRIPEPEGWNH